MTKMKKYSLIVIVLILFTIFGLSIYWYKQPYYMKYQNIAHALGGIDELDYTNSKEALELSYAKGRRLMEVDFLYTSDGHLVCRHNWNGDFEDGFSKDNIPDYETFMSSKIYGKYTTLDIEAIIQFAMEHPDVYFITDIKSYQFDIVKALEDITDTAKQLNYDNLVDQFVIQFYSYEDYSRIKDSFDFKHYIFTLYRMKDELDENGITNVLDFCLENNIKVVTLPKKYASKDICHELKENGIQAFAYTIDDAKVWGKLHSNGVDAIYTNYIYPSIFSQWFIKIVTFLTNN